MPVASEHSYFKCTEYEARQLDILRAPQAPGFVAQCFRRDLGRVFPLQVVQLAGCKL